MVSSVNGTRKKDGYAQAEEQDQASVFLQHMKIKWLGMQPNSGVVRIHRTLSLSRGTRGSIQSGLELDARLRSVKLLENYSGETVQNMGRIGLDTQRKAVWDVGRIGLDTSGKQFGTWDALDWQEPFR